MFLNKLKKKFKLDKPFIKPFNIIVDDTKIFQALGYQVYIRNGVGFGFISTEFLYDNGFLELGFGRTVSDCGDWGRGFVKASSCALLVIIDKNYVIKKVSTDSFYNNQKSRDIEVLAITLKEQLKVGNVFIIKDKIFKKWLEDIFKVIPCKYHIGCEVFSWLKMLEHDPDEKDYNIRDAKCKVK